MKKRNAAIILALFMSISCFLSACGSSKGGKTGNDNTLIIHDSSWEGIDLYQCSSWNDMQCLLADPIFEKDPKTGESIPGIASKSEWSEDGLTWTITFPEGMYYSTGKQVEPEDFIASVEWGRKVSGYASGYQNIESMKVDGRNVIVTLSEYAADMEYNFMSCFTGMMDKDELDSMSKDELLWGVHPYGAYYLDEYEPGAYAILKANEKYKTNNPLIKNKGASPIKTIKVVFTGENFTLSEGIKKGEYDVLSTVPTEYYDELSKAKEVTVVEAYGAEINYAEMNITDPLFQDENVRKAIILAISRDNIDKYIASYNKPAYSLILSKCLNYDEEAVNYYKSNYDYNVEEAKRLLSEAGWVDSNGDGILDKDGAEFSFTFSSRDSEQSKKIAQSMQVDLKAIGIDMQITTQEWSYVNQDVNDGKFQMAFLSLGWSEPFLLLDLFCQRNPKSTNPDSELQKQMVKEARGTIDYNERTKTITKIQKHIMDYKSLIPLADNTGFRCWRSEIQGIVYTPTGGFYLGDVVVDEDGNFRKVGE